MVVCIFGESCTGKSTIASSLKDVLKADVYTGKDYLRLAKNEQIARNAFQTKLQNAVAGENIIYVVAEKEHLALVPDGAVRVLVTADLACILQRFAQRMKGTLPPPVKQMLEKKHGMFDAYAYDFRVHNSENIADLCGAIVQMQGK